jgi:hypothetical protein
MQQQVKKESATTPSKTDPVPIQISLKSSLIPHCPADVRSKVSEVIFL